MTWRADRRNFLRARRVGMAVCKSKAWNGLRGNCEGRPYEDVGIDYEASCRIPVPPGAPPATANVHFRRNCLEKLGLSSPPAGYLCTSRIVRSLQNVWAMNCLGISEAMAHVGRARRKRL